MKPIKTDVDRRQFLRHCALGAAAVYLGRTVHAASPVATSPQTLDNPFFPYAFHDRNAASGETPVVKIPNPPLALKQMGYDGVGLHNLDILQEIASYREQGLPVFATWLSYDIMKPLPTSLSKDIAKLKGTGVMLWPILSIIQKGVVLPEEEKFDRALAHTVALADMAAAADLKVALYPHAGSVYCPSKAREGVALIKRANKPNLGVALNMCHENPERIAKDGDAIIAEALPHLYLATINGSPGLQPLGQGEFDVYGLFVKKLKLAGYNGPIGLQCWGTKDPQGHLEKSIKTWREYQARFAAEQKEK